MAGARLVAGALLVDPGFLGSGMGAAGVVGVADVGAADLGVAGVVVFAGVDAAGVVGVAVCAADLGVAGVVAAGVVVFAGVDAAGVVGVAVLDAADAAGGYCGLAFGGCGKPRFAFAFGSSFATSGFVAALCGVGVVGIAFDSIFAAGFEVPAPSMPSLSKSSKSSSTSASILSLSSWVSSALGGFFAPFSASFVGLFFASSFFEPFSSSFSFVGLSFTSFSVAFSGSLSFTSGSVIFASLEPMAHGW